MTPLQQQIESDYDTRFNWELTQETLDTMTLVREKCKELAFLMVDSCDPCKGQSTALTKLQEAEMWINFAIARNPASRDQDQPAT